MVKRKVANPLAFAVLGSLGERSMHPYEISTMLKGRGKDQSIKLNYGSLYSVVAALEKAGFIEAVRSGSRSPRRAGPSSRTGSPSCSGRRRRSSASWKPGWRISRRSRRTGSSNCWRSGSWRWRSRSPKRSRRTSSCSPRSSRGSSGSKVSSGSSCSSPSGTTRSGWPARSAPMSWRKMHEIVAESGISPSDVLKDPVKYFGEDLPWLKEVPPEGL